MDHAGAIGSSMLVREQQARWEWTGTAPPRSRLPRSRRDKAASGVEQRTITFALPIGTGSANWTPLVAEGTPHAPPREDAGASMLSGVGDLWPCTSRHGMIRSASIMKKVGLCSPPPPLIQAIE